MQKKGTPSAIPSLPLRNLEGGLSGSAGNFVAAESAAERISKPKATLRPGVVATPKTVDVATPKPEPLAASTTEPAQATSLIDKKTATRQFWNAPYPLLGYISRSSDLQPTLAYRRTSCVLQT